MAWFNFNKNKEIDPLVQVALDKKQDKDAELTQMLKYYTWIKKRIWVVGIGIAAVIYNDPTVFVEIVNIIVKKQG